MLLKRCPVQMVGKSSSDHTVPCGSGARSDESEGAFAGRNDGCCDNIVE